MEELGNVRFDGMNNAIRKKRTQTSRRPYGDSRSPLPSTPSSGDISKVSSDENNIWDTSSKRKELNLNQCVSRVSYTSGVQSGNPHKKIREENEGPYAHCNEEQGRSEYNTKRSSQGVLAPANWKSANNVKENANGRDRRNGESKSSGNEAVILDGPEYENKVKKVKLKVGGVTRTIHAKNTSNIASDGGPSSRSYQHHQENSDDDQFPSYKTGGLQGIPWKDFSKGGFSFAKEDSLMGRVSGKNSTVKRGNMPEGGRKSKRAPKRRVVDDEFDEDDEIRYLEKLKASKGTSGGYREDDEESTGKQQKVARLSDMENTGAARLVKDGKKKIRPDRAPEDKEYEEEEDSISDGGMGHQKRKKQKKESVASLIEDRGEMVLTKRQRALQSSKSASGSGSSIIEFPNGLPPAPKKQKEKLSEAEQQLRKAEAAERRKMQVEKAARESEAEAIRKILGQDSGRKKREDKIKKQQEERAQERAANALVLPPNTIRCVMGPTGTVVTFSSDMGLPSIFNSTGVSYPPPRENCAGPSCTNPYKYRDSKSKLPLCSLKCYKAIQEKMPVETTC